MDTSTAQMTVLFADIAGSTTLYESAGDTVALQAVQLCLDQLKAITVENAGVVIKSIGDEVLCCFPTPDQALIAASAMQVAVKKLGSLRVRIGFHYGSVVKVGNDIFGDAVNLAARVVALANPAQILTTRESYDSLSPYLKSSCRRLHSTTVKGRTEKVTLFEAIWAADDGLTIIAANRTVQMLTSIRLLLTYQGDTWELNPDSSDFVVGRSESSAAVIDLPTASRNHASICHHKGKFVLKDTSGNGTFVRTSTGDDYLLRREELVLSGSGEIGLGCAIEDCGDKVLTYEVKRVA